MENISKPENLTVYRKRGLTIFAAVLWLLLAAALESLILFAYFKSVNEIPEDKNLIIFCVIGTSIFAAVMLINSALCFNNLRYPCILATDEKGIYDYSGFVHCGFIGWDDIKEISGAANAEAFLDILADNQLPFVKIELKNYKATFADRSRLWRFIYLCSGFGCVNIRTLCSPLSRRDTQRLLCQRLAYYTDKPKTEN